MPTQKGPQKGIEPVMLDLRTVSDDEFSASLCVEVSKLLKRLHTNRAHTLNRTHARTHTHLFNGLPLEGIFFADDAISHIEKVVAELLDVVPAVVGGTFKLLRWEVSGQRQQLDKRHHVCRLKTLVLGVLQGLEGEVQQGRGLSQTPQTGRLVHQHPLQVSIQSAAEVALHDVLTMPVLMMSYSASVSICKVLS